jgi:hypothetical protein
MIFASIGNVAALKGVVKIKRDTSTINAKYGLAIEERDVVFTKDNSKVQIILKDETIVTIGENSKYSFSEYAFDNKSKAKAKMKLDRGFFRVITGKIGKIAPERFKVETKSATIGIRGTNFFALVNKQKEEIGCSSGKIFIMTNEMKRFSLAAGQMALLQADKTWKKRAIPRSYRKKIILESKKPIVPGVDQTQHNVLLQEAQKTPPPAPPTIPPDCLPQ